MHEYTTYMDTYVYKHVKCVHKYIYERIWGFIYECITNPYMLRIMNIREWVENVKRSAQINAHAGARIDAHIGRHMDAYVNAHIVSCMDAHSDAYKDACMAARMDTNTGCVHEWVQGYMMWHICGHMHGYTGVNMGTYVAVCADEYRVRTGCRCGCTYGWICNARIIVRMNVYQSIHEHVNNTCVNTHMSAYEYIWGHVYDAHINTYMYMWPFMHANAHIRYMWWNT